MTYHPRGTLKNWKMTFDMGILPRITGSIYGDVTGKFENGHRVKTPTILVTAENGRIAVGMTECFLLDPPYERKSKK